MGKNEDTQLTVGRRKRGWCDIYNICEVNWAREKEAWLSLQKLYNIVNDRRTLIGRCPKIHELRYNRLFSLFSPHKKNKNPKRKAFLNSWKSLNNKKKGRSQYKKQCRWLENWTKNSVAGTNQTAAYATSQLSRFSFPLLIVLGK